MPSRPPGCTGPEAVDLCSYVRAPSNYLVIITILRESGSPGGARNARGIFSIESFGFRHTSDALTNTHVMQQRLFIVGAKRTPFGAFGGKLKGLTATDLAVKATAAALSAAKVNPAAVDSVCIGNVQQTSPDAAYLARHVALKCDMATETPALNINRLCGSGFQSVVNIAHEILLGEARHGGLQP